MALNYVELSGTFDDGSGTPLSGTVSFTSNVSVYAGGIPQVTPDTPVTAQVVAGALKSAAGGTLQLLATDNSGLTFLGQTGFFYWTVAITVGGEVLPPWSFFLPHSTLGGGPVDLFSLANTAASGGGVASVAAGDASIVIGGTATAPTVETGTLDRIAALHPAAAAVGFGGQKATGLANGSAGTDAVAYGQLGSAAFQASAAFDAAGAAATAQSNAETYADTNKLAKSANLTDVAARQAALNNLTGTQSAGKYLRSDGTNASLQPVQPGDLGATPGTTPAPYLPLLYGAVWGWPWQFWAESYGAKDDGKIVSDAAITSGTNTLACTTSTPFTSTAVDGGKAIYIPGAGAAGADYVGTITSVTDSGHAVLSANAGTTVSGHGCVFGTDNTAAIKGMQAAGVTYAQSGRQQAEYLFSPLLHVVAGAAAVGGSTLGNSIFPRPVVAGTAAKLQLTYRCADPVDAAALPHWLQTGPQAIGACIAVLRLDGTLDGTYGPASVFGGPLDGYGGSEGGTFNNLQTVVDGLSLLLPNNSTFGGWDFYGDAECLVRSGSAFCMATVPSGTGWPQYSPASITNQWSYALRMPSQGNNARAEVGAWSAYGFTYGFMPSEHTDAGSVRTDYNITGIEGYASGTHGGRIRYASCEGNINALGFRDGVCHLTIDTLDVENNNTTIYDPQSFGNGTIGIRGLGQSYVTGVANGGLALKQVNLDMVPGPVSSPQAAPSSGSAWFNGYYRDAEIALSVSGGSLSALTITGAGNTISQAVPASTAYYRFTLPAGQSYTPTFTGTLTHTVTLL